MPTTRPRYQVTDTGRTRELLDRAARRWPALAEDRKALLLRLAEAGDESLADERSDALDAELRANAGRWVAVAHGRLLTAADDAAAVVTKLREQGLAAEQLFRVPGAAEDVAGEHGLA